MPVCALPSRGGKPAEMFELVNKNILGGLERSWSSSLEDGPKRPRGRDT